VIPTHILGRPVAARVETPGLAAWLDTVWHFPEHDAAPVAYAIEIVELDRSPETLGGEPIDIELHRVRIRARVEGRCWTLGDAAAGAQLVRRDERSLITVWGNAPGTYAALFVAVAESLRASGLLPLHAAVISREGTATVLGARSGAGKSTTLWRAVEQGWSAVAEDFAWLEPGTLRIYGWDRGIRLCGDARERFASSVPANAFSVDGDGKLFLAYAHVPRVERAARLGRLVHLRRGGTSPADASALVPLSPRDAVRAWWEATGVPLTAATRDRVSAHVAMLATSIPAFELAVDGPALSL
jgi:hypothetical protein